MADALRWYLALLAIGAGGLLPAALLADRLHSAGVLYARPLALAALAMLAWHASHFGLAPYGTPLVIGALALLGTWSATLAWRRPALRAAVRARARTLFVGEALFLLLFALLALARAQAPAALDTEKPMDLMLLTAVHRAERLPPPDPWFAGDDVSYYHLGHTAVDVTARLAGLGPGVAFNLGLATAGALAAVAAAGLAIDILALAPRRRRAAPWIAGATAALALLWLAPLAGALDLAGANGLIPAGVWRAVGADPPAIGATAGVPDAFWWWWNATRVLPGTIAEFPAFSLLLGDLHAHVLALPIGLVATALAVQTYRGQSALTWRRWLREPERLLLAALLFAALLMTNSWDVITFGVLWLLAAAVAFRRVGWSLAAALFGAGRYLTLPAALALLFVMPFLAGLSRPPLGLAPVLGEHSDPARFLLVWLAPLLPVVAASVLIAARGVREPGPGPGEASGARRVIAGAAAAAALACALWAVSMVFAGHGEELRARGSGWLTLALLAGGAGAAVVAHRRAEREGNAARALWLALVAIVCALLWLTEVIRIADAFPGRLNSVFKFWYHAWVLLAVAGGAAVGSAVDGLEPRTLVASARGRSALVVVAGAAIVCASTLLYAPAMAISRAREGQTRTLDARAGLTARHPAAAAAATWARATLDPTRDVLLQAPADSYSSGGLIAAASGVPTLVAWANHERQWRGPLPAIAARVAAADAIYGGGATAENADRARAWGVDYVYVGVEESARYGAAVSDSFAAWPIAFATAGAVIVAVPPAVTP